MTAEVKGTDQSEHRLVVNNQYCPLAEYSPDIRAYHKLSVSITNITEAAIIHVTAGQRGSKSEDRLALWKQPQRETPRMSERVAICGEQTFSEKVSVDISMGDVDPNPIRGPGCDCSREARATQSSETLNRMKKNQV